MTPEVQPARRPPSVAAIVGVASVTSAIIATAVTLLVTHAGSTPPPAPVASVAQAVPTPPPMRQTQRRMVVERSTSSMQIDIMGPTEFVPDGSPDDVFDLVIDADQPIANIFVTYDPQGLQWDTVIGADRIPFGGFTGHQGGETWTIGVRENGVLLNGNDGTLHGALRAGHHRLELVGNSPQGDGERLVGVMFADGSVKTAVVPAGHIPRD